MMRIDFISNRAKGLPCALLISLQIPNYLLSEVLLEEACELLERNDINLII